MTTHHPLFGWRSVGTIGRDSWQLHRASHANVVTPNSHRTHTSLLCTKALRFYFVQSLFESGISGFRAKM
ncbi:hypothetical protein Y032_0576g209 [Ancylostoma ceylanicum]|nr:hypothetical protein Y032_0576g209 [Ancylostoma ceylanicum]